MNDMDAQSHSWWLLFIYNVYRFVTASFFASVYFFNPFNVILPALYLSILIGYLICIVIFIYVAPLKTLNYERLILVSGVVDVLVLSSLLNLFVHYEFSRGVLLYVTIAILGVLAPGRLTVFFAALASSLLLLGNLVNYLLGNERNALVFFDCGVYGAGFFATALTVLYLSKRVRVQEALAKQHSEALLQMQRLNEYIVSRLHSGIIYVDEHQSIQLMNSAAKAFFNQERDSKSRKLHSLSPELWRKYKDFLARSRKKANRFEVILNEPYLRVHLLQTDLSASRKSVLIVLEDMSYIAKQAQQLKLAALGRLSASIAHELRNPLAAVAHASQLLGETGTLSVEEEHLRQLIINNCERMNGVIKNVLQLSRREKSKAEIMEISSFLAQFQQTFSHNNACTLKIKTPKKKLYIRFDKSQLEQLLVILCDNAIKYGTNEAGHVHIDIEAHSLSGHVEIKVIDSGYGVPAELRDKIFEPFFTSARNSTGMGLFIAKDLCEINQSTLNLDVREKGCSFSITQQSLEDILL